MCFTFNCIASRELFNVDNIMVMSRTLVGNKIIYHSDVVGASPIGAASTFSFLRFQYMASKDSFKTQMIYILVLVFGVAYNIGFMVITPSPRGRFR